MLSIALVHLIRGDCIHKVPFIVCVGEEDNGRKKSIPMWVLFLFIVFILHLCFLKAIID